MSDYSGAATFRFGNSVAIDGDTAVVGVASGGTSYAYAFVRDNGTWRQQARFSAPAGTATPGFGREVSVYGDTALVSQSDESAGAAHVYVRNGDTWSLEATLRPDDGASDDNFGCSLAIAQDKALVGSQYDDDNGQGSGSAYVFARGQTGWSQSAKLLPSDGVSSGNFGVSVSLDNEIALVGAFSERARVHAAYAFSPQGTSDHWEQTAVVSPEGASDWGYFGYRVAVSGDNALFGAMFEAVGDDSDGFCYFSSLSAAYVGEKNSPISIEAPGILANDSVGAGSLVTSVTAPSHGSLRVSDDGGFTYTPESGWSGYDTFTYRCLDGASYSDPATVRVLIRDSAEIAGRVLDGANDLPAAGIVVRAVGINDRNPQRSTNVWATMTAADGSYHLRGLPSGKYHITFIDPNDHYRDMNLGGWGTPVDFSPYIRLETGESLTLAETRMLTTATCLSQRFERVSGSTRYMTALEISRGWSTSDVAIVVCGSNFPDALSASALAGAYGAPILLSPSNAIPEEVLVRLEELQTTRVIIVGGEAAISEEAKADLTAARMVVKRIAGSDRYATSKEVVRHLVDTFGTDSIASSPFIARGDAFADALSAAPFAWNQIRPVVLVRPSSAPQSALEAVRLLQTDTVLVLGGTGAVSDSALTDLANDRPDDTIYYYRVAGSDRYDTSARLASLWETPYDQLGLASGADFPDALSGGPLMGHLGGALLLTRPTALPSQTKGVLTSNGSYLWQLRVFGGTNAVGAGTMTLAMRAAGNVVYDMDFLSGVSGIAAASTDSRTSRVLPAVPRLSSLSSEGEGALTARYLDLVDVGPQLSRR